MYIICGSYLIGMNFIGDFQLKSIIGIVCILAPILVAKLPPEESDNKAVH